jgi:hypothetical protein
VWGGVAPSPRLSEFDLSAVHAIQHLYHLIGVGVAGLKACRLLKLADGVAADVVEVQSVEFDLAPYGTGAGDLEGDAGCVVPLVADSEGHVKAGGDLLEDCMGNCG